MLRGDQEAIDRGSPANSVPKVVTLHQKHQHTERPGQRFVSCLCVMIAKLHCQPETQNSKFELVNCAP